MKSSRIQSIDALRGLIMIVMALDHTRDFFHFDAPVHDPLNLLYSPVDLFLTRWITHFCAPTFIFLTGLSAYLYSLKHTKSQLSKFLFTRGVWLILLELTVIHFGWVFLSRNNVVILQVIWAIGMSMVFLSLMVRLPYRAILVIGLAIIFLHNLLDAIHFTYGTFLNDLWILLHQEGAFPVSSHIRVFLLYPILPYFGLISVGYTFGKLFAPEVDSSRRKKILLWLGSSCIALFVILRYINLYGDPYPWEHQIAFRYTVLSFINCNKYPVSLLFALMILGPSILFLYFLEGIQNRITKILVTIGKVPMFYYVVHIYLIHCVAFFTGATNKLHLWAVYLVWLSVVIVLYFPCVWYGKYKFTHPEKWWLSYI
jgi:uncharacterized membrane protein